MKYTILNSYSIEVLEDKVNYYIKCGYVPQGGISTTLDGVKILYAQAMVKE